jgi:hypothetical protein
VFEAEITHIIQHPVFLAWLEDKESPKNFRDAGHFWGVAPGTPPRVVRQRIQAVEDTLEAARDVLDRKDVGKVGDRHGRPLYDKTDVERGLELHRTLKRRFEDELLILTGGHPI